MTELSELPCLSTSFKVGMLYDWRNSNLIPEVSLYDDSVLEAAVGTETQVTSSYEVIEKDSRENKAHYLDLTPDLNLSLLLGLVRDISGSTIFWNDCNLSKHTVRVCLKYQSTSHIKYLATEKLSEAQHCGLDKATHLVVKVLYGLNTFIVFDQEISNEESYDAVHKNMVKLVKNFSHMNDTEDRITVSTLFAGTAGIDPSTITCHIYGVTKKACSLREAVDFYKSLPGLGRDSIKSIPIKFWLCPLSKVDTTHSIIVKPVSKELVSQVQAMFWYLQDIEMQSHDTLSKCSDVLSKFTNLYDKLSQFAQLVERYTTNIKTQFSELIPQIREGKVDRTVLAEQIKEVESSPFSLHHLTLWMKQTTGEINKLNTLLEHLKNVKFVSSKELKSMVSSTCEPIVCFAFNLTGGEDRAFTNMQLYFQPSDSQLPNVFPQPYAWFRDTELIENCIMRFKLFAEANEATGKVHFLVTNAVPDSKISSILLYDGSGSSFQVWEPPGPPGKPVTTASDITQSTVQLEWEKPEYGSENVKYYNVSYYSPDNPQEIHHTSTGSAQESVSISGLTAGTRYLFKVRPVCVCGVGAESEASDVIESTIEAYHGSGIQQPTASGNVADVSSEFDDSSMDIKSEVSDSVKLNVCHPRPGKPNATNVTHNSIDLTWTKPKLSCEAVDNYTILYMSAHNHEKKWKKRMTDSKEETLTITELSPETKYIFKVRPELDDGTVGFESECSDPITTKPLFHNPRPGKPIASQVTHSSVLLNWTPPEFCSEIIDNYTVSYSLADNPKRKWKKLMTDNSEETLTITGLSPGTNYVYKVRPEFESGDVGCESEVSNPVMTKPISSQPVFDKPRASNVSHDTVQLQWNKPDIDESDSICCYTVFYCLYSDQKSKWKRKITDSAQQSLIVAGLTPETRYVFKVRPELEDGNVGPESEISDPVITNPLICISRPGKPVATNITHNCIWLTWTKPELDGKTVEISGYAISYSSADDSKKKWKTRMTDGTEESLAITGLTPETRYIFKIRPELEDGTIGAESELSDPVVTRSTSPPQKPFVASDLEVTHNSVCLKWAKPDYGAEDIVSYSIICHSLDFSEQKTIKNHGTQESAVVTGLLPKTKYIFKVQPNTVSNVGSVSCSSDPIETKPASPPGIPTASTQTFNSIKLQWQRPDIGSEHIKRYIVLYSELDNLEQKETKTEGLNESIVIQGLKINTGYRFKVCPEFVEDGVGVESEISDTIFTDATSSPGKPISMDSTHDNIQIQWTEPQYGSENIECYSIYYRSETFAQDQWNYHDTEDTSLQATISGLKINSSYFFKVVPESKHGILGNMAESETSDPIKTRATSQPGIPAPVQSTITHNDIVHIELAVTHNSVALKWDEPERGSENIDHYVVYYRATNKSALCEQKATRHNVHVVKDLVPNRGYRFKVQTICKCGDGALSDISDEIETEPVCSPGKPSATLATHNGIRIKWTNPEYYHQHVDYYQVFYRKVSDQSREWEQVRDRVYPNKGEFQFCFIEDLECNEHYLVKVYPVTELDGLASVSVMMVESEVSEPIATKSTSSPGKPTVCRVSYNFIELKWTKPVIGANSIKHYNVIYYKNGETDWKTTVTEGARVSTVMKGLTANTEYIFKVQPITECGSFGCESDVSKPVKTDVTCKPGRPRGTLVTHNTITLRWGEPEYHQDAVDHYTISYSSQSDPSNKWTDVPLQVTSKFGAHISNLSASTAYTFKVHPVPSASCIKDIAFEDSISDPISTRMTSPPGKPTRSDIHYNSIEIKWTKPDVGSESIKYYTVVLYKSSKTIQKELKTQGSQESMIVGGLDINTGYRFKVRPECGEAGVGTESEISDTIYIKATSPPGKPTATSVTHDSITISWTEPKRGKENVESYSIHYRDVSQTTNKWFYVTAARGRPLCHTLSKLSANTTYSVLIRPVCKDRDGTDSECSDKIFTNASSPPSKPTVDEITHNSITLKWKKPNFCLGTLKGYSILYRPAKSPHRKWECISCTAVLKFIVDGLSMNTAYQFKILPELESGYGTGSVISDSITTKATSPPGQPQATDDEITYESVTLRWSKPDCFSDNIKGYRVFYYPLSNPQQTKSQRSIGVQESITIRGLDTKRKYIFKVRSICDSGIGSDSEKSIAIETQPACKPGVITPAQVLHNSISLQWAKPEFFSDHVKCYTVSYRDTKAFWSPWHQQNTNEPSESITLTNLNPKTAYEFKILPHCTPGIKAVEAFGDQPLTTTNVPLAERKREQWSRKLGGPVEKGHPAIYRVQVKNVKKEVLPQMFTRCNVCRHNPGTKEKVVMLVGATGSGKSTLINSIVNYMYGVRWEHDFRFKLISNESTLSQAHSQTDGITAYTLNPKEGSPVQYALTIVDTPGFGDTRGIQRDKEITKHIKEFFSVKPPSGINQINAIGFVVQASSARLTPTQKYVFDSILAMFPGKDIANNIFLMSTFADGQKPQVLAAIKEADIHCSKGYSFNNSSLYNKSDESDESDITKFFWDMNRKSLRDFLLELEYTEPKSLQLTIEVPEMREQLEVSLQGLQQQLSAGLGLIQELQQEEKVIEKHGIPLTDCHDYTYNVEVSK